MKLEQIRNEIATGRLDKILEQQCGCRGKAAADIYRKRILSACDGFEDAFGADRDVFLFSVGGRTEVSGNHTDHNRGKVLCAAVDLDIIAVAAVRSDDTVRVKSQGFPMDTVSAVDTEAPCDEKRFSSGALIAGVRHAFKENGYTDGGFDAYTTSAVLKGSGLSSSAAFEVMIGNILNHLYNGGEIQPEKLAEMAQYAENVFFGKPCGLMDQMACAVGGFIYIDFARKCSPFVEKLDFDPEDFGLRLCIVDTKCDHSDLNGEYAAIPAEMKSVAAQFGREVLREVDEEELLNCCGMVRRQCGDRAFLRAMHFMEENERVERQRSALKHKDAAVFMKLVEESGDSSYKFLQNIYAPGDPKHQGVAVALCIAQKLLSDAGGVCRIHGGGFAGTIQAFVPESSIEDFRSGMEKLCGAGACHVLSLRRGGALRLL